MKEVEKKIIENLADELQIEKQLVEDIASFQAEEAVKAMEKTTDKSVEISGFFKFVFNTSKAQKTMNKMHHVIKDCESKLETETDGKKIGGLKKKLKSAKYTLASIQTKYENTRDT